MQRSPPKKRQRRCKCGRSATRGNDIARSLLPQRGRGISPNRTTSALHQPPTHAPSIHNTPLLTMASSPQRGERPLPDAPASGPAPQFTIAPAGARESQAPPITIFRGSVRRLVQCQATRQHDCENGAQRRTGIRKARSLWHESSQLVKLCHLPIMAKVLR